MWTWRSYEEEQVKKNQHYFWLAFLDVITNNCEPNPLPEILRERFPLRATLDILTLYILWKNFCKSKSTKRLCFNAWEFQSKTPENFKLQRYKNPETLMGNLNMSPHFGNCWLINYSGGLTFVAFCRTFCIFICVPLSEVGDLLT